MIYIKNTITNEIEQFLQIPSDYYGDEKKKEIVIIEGKIIEMEKKLLKSEYEELSENDVEVQEKILLPEIKEKQIALIKKARDEEMNKEHFSTSAYLLEKTQSGYLDFALDVNGEKIKKEFEFNLKSGNSSINQPDVILSRILFKAINQPDFYLPYSCKFSDATKGYVAIDEEIANTISNHLQARGTNAVFLANELEEQINSIFISENKNFQQVKEEIENINFP
jgi:hypothetical protein